MASVKRTAYPGFTKTFNAAELEKIFYPSESELKFMNGYSSGKQQNLTLLVLLKTHQYLGYFPAIVDVPKQVLEYLSHQLFFQKNKLPLKQTTTNKKTFHRYHKAIRNYLDVSPWSKKTAAITESVIKKAALTMSNPADLINVAIEKLVEQRCELPAFSTLNRIAGRIRKKINQQLYIQVSEALSSEQKKRLNQMLKVKNEDRITDFTRLKQSPGKPSLKLMHKWIKRLEWLKNLLNTTSLLKEIAHTKVLQFSAEVAEAEPRDLLDMLPAKRYAHLVCFINQKQVQTKDQLVDMFLRRMQKTRNKAEAKLEFLRAESRAIEEQMLAVFSQIAGYAIDVSEDRELGKMVRLLIRNNGGANHFLEQYLKVSTYHDNNYLPLLWNIHRQNRKAIFLLIELLDIRTATQDKNLLKAMNFILKHQRSRQDYLPREINLEFMNQKWRTFVEAKYEGVLMLDRRKLEVAVLFHIADGLRCADLYVPDSQQFQDYRQQLLGWNACKKLLKAYCCNVGLPSTAKAFTQCLKDALCLASTKADEAFPHNSELSIDEKGKPHLKRQRAKAKPEGFAHFQEIVRNNMPQRDLLDILKRIQCWTPYTRHFTPPSGSDPKLKNAVTQYLFTVFSYGCNLGAGQTARHTVKSVSSRSLRRVNKQHVNATKLDAAATDIINEYNRCDLPFVWGDGSEMIVDGTLIELVENNIFGEHHIRYGNYGGIAYKYLSDTYIALFNRFIACGTWEAIHILDAFLANKSDLIPHTVHADTQGQSEPVFALSYLMGIKLMPRMRNWDDVYFYRPEKTASYKHIDSLFNKVANWEIIETHWKDFMQVALSVHAGKILPSMLLRRLGVRSKKNKLYQVFRALGQVVRTIFLLQYIADPEMRRHINAATTKVESFHSFCDWITFGGKKITSGDPVEQEKQIKYTDLIANIIMLHNVVDLTTVLNKMHKDGELVNVEFVKGLSPFLREHIRRFGEYRLNMDELPEPLKPQILDFKKGMK